jgi:penicillin-binding protein 2
MDWENVPYILKKELEKNFSFLTYIFLTPIILIYILITYYQVIRGDYYYNIAEQNRLRAYTINAPRGNIYDINGRTLVDNRPSITILYYPIKQTNKQEITNLLSILPESKEKLFFAVKSQKIVPLVEDVNRELFFKLLSMKHRISNIFISTEFKRRYVEKENFAHVIGYIGELNYSEYLTLKSKGYNYNDLIGKAGIERSYEEYLRGRHGALLMEVDAKGVPTKIIKNIIPTPGENIYLTIDKDLQATARNALAALGKNGAVVGIDPRNGAIRILVSYKDFDPNIFISSSKEERKKILQDKNLPLFNRAIQGIYPPGSTFKILTSIAALNENKVSYDTKYFCPGGFKFGEKIFKCWEKKGHGNIDFFNAIRLSCNVFFINLGLRVGIDNIEKYGRMFNFDDTTGVDLPSEVRNILPSKRWKKEKFKIDWYEGDTASVSIGQGYVSVTPIQMALFASVVANKGTIYQPYVVEKIISNKGDILYQHTPVKKGYIKLNDGVWEFIHKAMMEVVNSGTGSAAYIPNFKIAGKTGTAQNPHGIDHAWFICFGPIKENETPELALAIVVEHGGKGGSVAAPIAREIFTAFINKTTQTKIEVKTTQTAEEYGD